MTWENILKKDDRRKLIGNLIYPIYRKNSERININKEQFTSIFITEVLEGETEEHTPDWRKKDKSLKGIIARYVDLTEKMFNLFTSPVGVKISVVDDILEFTNTDGYKLSESIRYIYQVVGDGKNAISCESIVSEEGSTICIQTGDRPVVFFDKILAIFLALNSSEYIPGELGDYISYWKYLDGRNHNLDAQSLSDGVNYDFDDSDSALNFVKWKLLDETCTIVSFIDQKIIRTNNMDEFYIKDVTVLDFGLSLNEHINKYGHLPVEHVKGD
jgi:hypothetical protein